MTNSVKVFDRSCRRKNAEFLFVFRFFDDCLFDCAHPLVSVIRMNALYSLIPTRDSVLWIESPDAVPFIGQIDCISSFEPPDPSPYVCDSLRFRQVGLGLR